MDESQQYEFVRRMVESEMKRFGMGQHDPFGTSSVITSRASKGISDQLQQRFGQATQAGSEQSEAFMSAMQEMMMTLSQTVANQRGLTRQFNQIKRGARSLRVQGETRGDN